MQADSVQNQQAAGSTCTPFAVPGVAHLHLLESISNSARVILTEWIELDVTDVRHRLDDVESLDFTYPTVYLTVAVAGQCTHICVNFEAGLMNCILQILAHGLSFSASEQRAMVEWAAGDVLNVIIGHATGDLDANARVEITPPRLIEAPKTLVRRSPAIFFYSTVKTRVGNLRIYGIEPTELFNENLEYR